MDLLIHADPGARSGFVASWLSNCLTELAFDSGATLKPTFVKVHKIDQSVPNNPYKLISTVEYVASYAGTKIRIRPRIQTIGLHCLLFMRKNINVLPKFMVDEYSFETYSSLATFSKDIIERDLALDNSLYDVVLDFADTFDNQYMINLYKNIVGTTPTPNMIDMLTKTNKLNTINIDKNNACSILKLCLTREQELGLKEIDRFWSIVDIYKSTPIDKLYDTVFQSIVPENYNSCK